MRKWTNSPQQGELQDKIDASNAWEIDRMVDGRWKRYASLTNSVVTHLSEANDDVLRVAYLAKPGPSAA